MAAVEGPVRASHIPTADAFITRYDITAEKAKEAESSITQQTEPPTGLNKEVIFVASRDFAAVRVYVQFGAQLPFSAAEFERLYNKNDLNAFFDKPGKSDAFRGAYVSLSNAFVNVYTHCKDFNDNTLVTIQSWSSQIVANAQTIQTNLEREINQLKLLIGSSSLPPADREKIANRAITYLTRLNTECTTLAKDAGDYSVKFNKFRSDTESDRTAFSNLATLVFSEDTIKAETDALTSDIQRLDGESQGYLSEYNHYKNVAIGVGASMFWNVAGWVVGPLYGKRASDALAAYNEKIAEKQQKDTQLATLLRATTSLKGLKTQTDKMAEIVGAAIAAITKMGTSASQMKTSFLLLSTNLANGANDIKDEYIQEWIEDFEKVLPEWKKILYLAQQFMNSGGVIVKPVQEATSEELNLFLVKY